MKKINAHNAPAFCRHLQTLSKLAGGDCPPYPFQLLATLQRLENKAHRITTAECNGEMDSEVADEKLSKIADKVRALLPNSYTFFINCDARGHALKIKPDEARELGMWSDMGGYGIICPDF